MLRYRSIASLVAQSHNARVVLLYAYEGARDGGREEYLSRRAAALSGFGVELEPLEEPVRTEHGKRSFEQILATCEKKRCDLIVIPAPYLDDYVKLGQESVGAHLDMLPCRAASALLVVREPQADPQRCLANLLLPVAPYEATTVQAAGWALKLLSQNGLLRVLAIAETAAADSEDALLVLASLPDPRSLAQMRTAALVRASRNPVLVVR